MGTNFYLIHPIPQEKKEVLKKFIDNTWKKLTNRFRNNNLTLNISDMADDLLEVYNTFKSVDELPKSNSGQWLACKQMYENWLNKYRAVTNADLDVKAAYCSIFVKMIAGLFHSNIALPMVSIQILEK